MSGTATAPSIFTRLRTARPRRCVRFLGQQKEIFLLSSPSLGPTLTRIQWVPLAPSPAVKPPESEIYLLLPSSAEVKYERNCASIPSCDVMTCTDTTLPLHYFYPYCTKTCCNEVRRTLEANSWSCTLTNMRSVLRNSVCTK